MIGTRLEHALNPVIFNGRRAIAPGRGEFFHLIYIDDRL